MTRRQRKKNRRSSSSLPKGAYRLPAGGVVLTGKTTVHGNRHIRITGVMRDEIDTKHLARALLEFARQQHK